MAKSKAQKKETIATLTEKYSRTKSAVFIDYTGLTVADVTDLRKKAKAVGSEYVVAKKTLFARAFGSAGLDGTDAIKGFSGNLGVILGYEDEVFPAKLSKDFAKSHGTMAIRAGIMEGKFIDVAMVSALAAIPGKQELLAKLVGSINAPVSGFVTVLSGNLRGLVRVLDGIRAQKS